MLFQEPLESRSCHWKEVEVDPSGSERSAREAERVLPSAGEPAMFRFAEAGLVDSADLGGKTWFIQLSPLLSLSSILSAEPIST